MRRLIVGLLLSLLSLPALAQQTRVVSTCSSIAMAWTANDLGRPIMFDTNGRMCVAADGSVAAAATDAGNPVKIGGVFNSTLPTYTTGQRTNIQTDQAGRQYVVNSGSSATNAGITSSVSSAAEAGRVLKGSAGNLYSFAVTNLTATAGFVVVTNTTTVPADGAVTPFECVPIAANGRIEVNYNPGPATVFSTGISIFITSAATCFTKTTGVVTGFFRGSTS